MAFVLAGAADAALTEQQVNEALGSVPGVAWSVEGPDAEAWTVTGTGAAQALKFSSAVATGTFALKAVVTGPGVLEVTTSRVNTPFFATFLLDGEARAPEASFWGKCRISVGPGTHTLTWQGTRTDWTNTLTRSATFQNAKWEPYAELPLSVGAKDSSVTLSGAWVGQDLWHRGDGGAAYSVLGRYVPQPPLQADFTGPGILTYWVLPRINGEMEIDGQLRGAMSSSSNLARWIRKWHGVGPGSHVAKWINSGDMVVDEVQLVQEVDLTTALDVPGRVWTSTTTGESRTIGLPTDGAVGGSAVVLARGASFSTQFAGGGIFKIRQRGSVPVFSLNGYGVSYDSITDPDSEWVTRWVVIPQAGGVFSIAANSSDAEFDAAEWVPTPATFAEIFGLPAQTTTTGGEGTWKAELDYGMSRFVARTSLTHATPTAWVDMVLTGPAKAVIGYQSNGRGVLEFLLDGEALWDTTVSEKNEVTLDIPAGQHVVRCLARNVSGSEGYAFTPVIRGVKVVADEHAGDIPDALDYPSRWIHSGDWEKVVTPAHDGAAALRPVVPEGALGEVSPWLGTTVTGPGYLSFWMSNPDEQAAMLTMHGATLTGEFPEIRSVEAGWLEHRQWFPEGKHKVQLSLTGSREMMGRTFLDGMSFSPSAPAALESVSTGGPVVWENDPQRPWTAVVKEPGTPAVAMNPVPPPGVHHDEAKSRVAATMNGPGLLTFRWERCGRRTMSEELWVNGVRSDKNLNGVMGSSETIELPQGENRVEWVSVPQSGAWLELSEVDWQALPESSLASALDAPEGVTWASGGDTTFTGRPDANAKGGTAARVWLGAGQSSWIEGTMNGPGVFDFWLRPGATSGYEWQYLVNWVVTVDGTEVLRSGMQMWNPIWVRGAGEHKVRVTFTNPTSGMVSGSMDEVTWIPLVQRTLDASWAADVSEPVNGYEGPDGSGYVLRTSYFTPSWMEKTVTGPCEVSWDSLLVGPPVLIAGQPTVTVDGKAPVVISKVEGGNRNVLVIPAGEHVIRWANVADHDEANGLLPPEEMQGSFWRITDPVVTPGVSPMAEALDAPGSCWLVQGVEGGVITGAEAMDGVDAYALGEDRTSFYLNLSGAAQRLRGGIRDEEDESWRVMRMVVEAGAAIQWGGAYGFAQPRAYDLDAFSAETLTETPLHEAVDLAEELPPQEGWRGIVSATESADGVDSAWSFVNTLFQSHDTGMTVNTAGRVRFRWKHQGASSLEVRLNGAPLPLVAGGEWTEVSFEVGNGENRITWLHENVDGTSEFATGEAWLDAISFEELPAWDLTAAAAAGLGVVLSTDEPLDDLLQWKAVKATLPGGDVVSAARAATGSALMRASITGPVVVNFRGACFADKAAETVMAGRNARGGKFESSGSGTWVIGGSGGEHAGYELTVMMGEKLVGRVPYRDGVEWSDVSFFVPEGTHAVTWQLNRLRTTGIPESFSREAATWTDLQGWVSGIWLESARERFDRWAETLPEGKRGPDEDADGDGVSNVLEYAFRSSPGDASSVPPQVTGGKGPPIAQLLAGHWVIGTQGMVWVPYDTSAPTAAYELMVPYLSQFVDATVEMSADLESWDEHPVQWLEGRPPITMLLPNVTGHTDTHQSVRIPLYEGDTAKFFRVKVAVPE